MKKLLKQLLKYYLKYIAKIVLLIHRPVIIAIGGSTNKTFVKNQITQMLAKEGFSARGNSKSYNTEIGLPLAILNLPSGYNDYKRWKKTIYRAPKSIFRKKFPQYLVLELGVSDPGDMQYLLTLVKPQICIITDLSQRYLESFGDMDKITEEYEELAKSLSTKDLMIINIDNSRLCQLAELLKSRLITFGFAENSTYRITDAVKNSDGQSFTVCHDNHKEKCNINKFGVHNIYAFVIALIVKDYVKQKKH